jgi:hypothetical protein
MTGRVQTLRSSVAGSRPTGRQPGELYVNFADSQLGVVNATSAAQDLIGVTYFSTTSAYVVGQFVIQAGQLYRCVNATGPGAFTPIAWGQIGGSIVVGDSPPANPQPGTLWWDSVGGQLYVLYNDGNTVQWVIVVNTANFPSITIGATPPANPAIGSLWWDSVGGQMYIWFNDGSTSQWVATTNQIGGGYLPLSGGAMTGPVALMGVTDGSDAAPGQIGEVISINVTAPVTLPAATATTVASIALTAGDWDVSGEIWVVLGATVGGIVQAGINSFSAALPTASAIGISRTTLSMASTAWAGAGATEVLPLRTCRISLAAPATYYLVGYAGNAATATGNLIARRAR